jgi:hypothetical protein
MDLYGHNLGFLHRIFMEHFQEIALDTADHKSTKGHRYIDSTFVVWSLVPGRFQQFPHHFNSLRPTIKFTVEDEANDTIPFLDSLVMKRGSKLALKVYYTLTHKGHYLNFK